MSAVYEILNKSVGYVEGTRDVNVEGSRDVIMYEERPAKAYPIFSTRENTNKR